jgi:hypothetical protein
MNNPVRGEAVLSDWGRQAAVIGEITKTSDNASKKQSGSTPVSCFECLDDRNVFIQDLFRRFRMNLFAWAVWVNGPSTVANSEST